MFSCLAGSPKKKSSSPSSSSKKLLQSPSVGGSGKISTRKLLARILPQPPSVDADDSEDEGGGISGGRDLHGQLHALMKHLQRSDRLAKLSQAIEIGTGGQSDCVRLEPSSDAGGTNLQLGRHQVNARQLCLRAWRYPDLTATETLTPMTEACCSKVSGQCINPFHFYRTLTVAPDLHSLIDRLSELELKQPLIALSDNEVSSSGCSSDSLLSASRKSWLTTTSSAVQQHQQQHRDTCSGGSSSGGGGCGSCSCCSCCCCYSASVSDAHSSTAAAASMADAETAGNVNAALSEQRHQAYWCAVAYWEGRSRIGQLARVRDSVFRICQRGPVAGTGSDSVMSLESLSAAAATAAAAVPAGVAVDPDGELARQAAKTRAKIGAGVALVRRRRRRRRQHRQKRCQFEFEDDSDGDVNNDDVGDDAATDATELMIFNQSDHAVFVHSPTLQPLSLSSAAASSAGPYQAVKLPPGYCLKAFDSSAAGLLCRARRLGQLNQLCSPAAADPFTVRLSFVKGFGAAYQRQDIIYCPCWLEVMLSFNA
ncbi:hypothetical protein BOX15_Mlig032059g1 [Macrostomum lignano]|uniref:Mothers against decapentaplegic homolog n=1 Tax=Macrostomum lignano TaxID=282301 RepID=A0A267E6U2_9PLAT|nr:hypothetical protein BOX15_Mlig032059g1 [Macrostomum lignano]